MHVELEGYRSYLGRLPISPHTRRNYLLRVKQYLRWLEDTPDGSKALVNPVDRDFAVQDYKIWLLHRGASGNTINSTLTALDNLHLYIGLGAAKVKRQDHPSQSPRALEPEEQRRLLKEISRSGLRNQVVALIMLHCGLRISEVAELDVSDVALSARKREIVVRCGKNSKRRTIPINHDLAEILLLYLPTLPSNPETPLFVSKRGSRLSVKSIDHLIRQLGKAAGIEFSSHCLRHTCLTKLLRSGVDIVTVAEIAGHARLETVRRYTLPTERVKVEAMERLNYGATSA